MKKIPKIQSDFMTFKEIVIPLSSHDLYIRCGENEPDTKPRNDINQGKRIKPNDSILHPTPNSLMLLLHRNSLHPHTPELLKVSCVRAESERVGDCIRLLCKGL